MTVSEIIAELPKLSEKERREILHRILELVRQDQEMKFADELFLASCRYVDKREKEDATQFLKEAALQTFRNLDKLEEEDARRKTR